jgi:hypothetical protein
MTSANGAITRMIKPPPKMSPATPLPLRCDDQELSR